MTGICFSGTKPWRWVMGRNGEFKIRDVMPNLLDRTLHLVLGQNFGCYCKR